MIYYNKTTKTFSDHPEEGYTPYLPNKNRTPDEEWDAACMSEQDKKDYLEAAAKINNDSAEVILEKYRTWSARTAETIQKNYNGVL